MVIIAAKLVRRMELSLTVLVPDCSEKQEARVLMNNKAEMTMDDLREVLLENEVKSFDPVAEAFKVHSAETEV